jgi:hypothetical protein
MPLDNKIQCRWHLVCLFVKELKYWVIDNENHPSNFISPCTLISFTHPGMGSKVKVTKGMTLCDMVFIWTEHFYYMIMTSFNFKAVVWQKFESWAADGSYKHCAGNQSSRSLLDFWTTGNRKNCNSYRSYKTGAFSAS